MWSPWRLGSQRWLPKMFLLKFIRQDPTLPLASAATWTPTCRQWQQLQKHKNKVRRRFKLERTRLKTCLSRANAPILMWMLTECGSGRDKNNIINKCMTHTHICMDWCIYCISFSLHTFTQRDSYIEKPSLVFSASPGTSGIEMVNFKY